MGGPIRRDKTFFFADYQGAVTHSATPMITSLPSPAQRSGDFSASASVPIYNPFGASLARTPFANNVIPATMLDPAALQISALLPQANQFGAGGPLPFNNYAVTRTATANVESYDIRVDHQFSERNTVFVRDSFQNTDAVSPSLFGLPLGGTVLGAGPTAARNQNAGVGDIHQFSAFLIQEVRVGLNRQTEALLQQDNGENLSSQFGIPGINTSPQTSGLSTMAIAGLFNVGDSLLTPLRLASTDWTFSDKLTWVKGRHVFRFGFDDQYEMGSTGYLVYGRGYYTFLNLTTSSLVGTPGGNAFASFLTGAPYEVLRDEFPPGMVGLISNRYGFFAQDDIKLTRRLTVNLGARYDVMPYPREMHDRLSNFDPATRTMLIAGENTSAHLVSTDYKDLAPRIGLAWAPGDGMKTVIRAGYGIGFMDPLGAAGILNSNEFNVPFYYVSNITQFPYTAQTYTLSNALPALAMPSATAPSGNQRYIVPNDGNPYSQTWSLLIERALTPSLMIEAGYVGTSGVRLLTASGLNDAPPGSTAPTSRQPYGAALSDIRELSNSAQSTYHALDAKLEKRFSRGVYFLGTYTFSKSIDNQSNGTDTATASGQYPQDPLNTSLDRGLSSFDRTHRFVASLVWEIPFGRGRAFGANAPRVVDGILGGWQLSGIFTAETGAPFSVLINCADINGEGNNCRPNRLSNGALSSSARSINEWFNTAAFAVPAPAAYGNAGRNILRGPGLIDTDLALSRSFRWGSTERRLIQIRSEFFNASNHTNLGLPVNSLDSPAFGSIISARAGARYSAWRSSSILRIQSMIKSLKRVATEHGRGIVRNLLPLLTIGAALGIQGLLSLIVPRNRDFPFAFFYLLAVFVTAWFGGYVQGVVACLITMVLLPWAAVPGFKLSNIDHNRLVLFVGISVLVSWVSAVQRRARETLRRANDELDERVQARTQDLTQAIQALEAEIGQRKTTEKKLQTQLERLNLLDQITRAIAERQDLQSIFQVVIRSLEDSLPIDFGCICRYDAVAAEFTVICVGVHSETLAMELALGERTSVPIEQNGMSRCVTGQLIYEPDLGRIEGPFPRKLFEGGLKSLVAAPLFSESKIYGVLFAGRRDADGFTSGECECLRQLGDHVALAAHQAEIHTALQQAYDDLHQSQQTVMQQERLRALGQMASGIAHDINNAISPVALYTEALLEKEPNLSARTRSYLETTQRAIEDVAHTVARMREFYRKPEPQLTLTPVHLDQLVQQVVDLTRVRWRDIPQQRGILIDQRTEVSADLPAVPGIESEIREALTNLVFNAVDAMPEGGTLTIRIGAIRSLAAAVRAQHVLLEVSDTGIGMSEETRRRCLEPFFTTKGDRGTGLGLAMVYGVAQRHSADVEIDSEVGKGTTIRLKFPAASGNEPAQRSLPSIDLARLRILVVDDDPLLIKSLRDTLESDGHAVTTANGGQKGIDSFCAAEERQEPFDVVITDLGMPTVDGRKVARAVKAANPLTPVILLTGWGQRMIAEGDVPPHVDLVLSKPPKLRELRTALKETCEARTEVALT